MERRFRYFIKIKMLYDYELLLFLFFDDSGSIQSSLAPGGDVGGHTAVGISSVDWSVAGMLSADRSGSVVQWRS